MTALPTAANLANTDITEATFQAAITALRDHAAESLGGLVATTFTIAAGAITPTTGSIVIDGPSGSNNLTNVTPAGIASWDGKYLVGRIANASRTITLKHLAGGSGQLKLASGGDYTLTKLTQFIMFRYSNTDGYWEEVFRGALPVLTISAKAATFNIAAADFDTTFMCTGTYSVTFSSVASLGADFQCYIRNNGTGVLTLDPNAAETIDGASTITVPAGETVQVFVNGGALSTRFRVPEALETLAGIVKIATQAQADAGADDATAISPLKLKTLATTFANLLVFTKGKMLAQTLTDGATIAWDGHLGQTAKVTLGGNRVFGAPTNQIADAFYSLTILTGAGSFAPTWNSVFKFKGGTAPTITAAASARDEFVFKSDGTNMYEVGRNQDVK